MRNLRIFALGAALLCLALPAGAQGVQTGSIAGAVLDNDGIALPGVYVVVTGATLQGQKNAISGADGGFRFPILPPGEYTVSFTLEGFDTLQHTEIPVYIGNTTEIQATMSLAQFGESIEVTADRVVVDTTKSTVDYAVTFDELDKLATNRWYQDVLQMVPGVQNGNNPAVHGNSGSSNLYLVDGVDTSDARTKGWGKALNFDTVAEVQVQTAGISAEYGRAVGGIMNVVTKSGGNEFHGTFRWVESRSEWASDYKEGRSGGGRTDESRPVVTLGGPILNDKLWFYVGYEERDNSRGFDWYDSIDDRLNNELSQGRTEYAGHYLNAKLTWQADTNHNIVAFFNEDPITLSPLNRGWNGQNYHIDTEQKQFQGGWNGSLQWTGVFTDNFFMSSKFQMTRAELNVEPDSPTWGTDIPYTYDYGWDYRYGAPDDHYQSFRYRDGLLVDGTYFHDTGKHSHQFKGGIEYMMFKPEAGTINNLAGSYRTTDGLPTRRFLTLDQTGLQKTEQDYWAVFFQDEWRLGNLTLNLGIRAESEAMYNNMGEKIQSFDFTDMLAPRLGFAYDLNGDSLHGSLSRFYYLPTTYIASYFNVSTDHQQRWDWNDTCDPTGMNYWEFPDTCWDLIYDVPTGAGGYTLDQDLKATYQDSLTLGYRKRLNDEMAAGVTFVWRQQDDQIDVYDPEFSGDYLITNVPKYQDFGRDMNWTEYQAVMFDFEKRYSDDRISIMANYTYSFKADSWSFNWWRDLGVNWTFWNPELVNTNFYGRTESPHTFKVFSSYITPWDMVVGVNGRWNSGNVYEQRDAGDFGTVYIEERGSRRVGNNWEADLYIEQPFTIGPVSVSAYANIFNVFDNQQPIRRVEQVYSDRYGTARAWQNPRSYQLGFKLEF